MSTGVSKHVTNAKQEK